MNREDTKVVPFRTAASPYNAEIEKKRNVIGQQLAKAVRDCGYSKKAFCEVLKNYGVDVTHSALGKWTNGLTVPSAYQLVAIATHCILKRVFPTLQVLMFRSLMKSEWQKCDLIGMT